MLSSSQFRDLVSGRSCGAGASLLRALLRAAAVPYTGVVRWKNWRYDRGQKVLGRAGVPVVSIGNLTLGGTGKTPMVQWIARWFIERGVKVALVSRGYGAAPGQRNDEARELEKALPGVPHVQNPDRVAAAHHAVREYKAELILLDDGFQHRRLARDLDVVLLDSLEPFGFEHVFPRGTLREPMSGLSRAGVVCLSRADAISLDQRAALRNRAVQLAPAAVWCEVAHTPTGLVNGARETRALESLAGCRVVAFCGIGNPAGFRHTLNEAACQVVAWREFPDHHDYRADDIEGLGELAKAHNADMLLCTQKDLVKIERTHIATYALWAVTIEMRFLNGQNALEELLRKAGNVES